ncbi:hypothetical protein [Sinomonas terrae]|uniref:NmrA-like domain-containing protein n=1 Tax=Sinomonas terrae TaxID=2908838 RepID=A0ABS9TVV9_9MICC|nr:hypothetical protein [Sinomonas terrae]MCH6468553.1 hypothetical protein [Sinomonas terrae]
MSMQDTADISSSLLGREIRVAPRPGKAAAGGARVPQDMAATFEWFATGRYVADTKRQQEVFGVPTAEDAVGRFITSLGHRIRE